MYVVVNNKNIYELKEQQPILIDKQEYPISIIAKNGFHFSTPLLFDETTSSILLIGVSCTIDNGKFIGCILLSSWLFIIYFSIHNYAILLLANLPILYVMYYFFWKPKEFLNVRLVNKK